ncbi:MAG: CoA-binding protein [Chloroflexota bacterium]|nr:CoA-binding protein [Chloroflexota bacterium]MXZ45480.1 CoA-binding protein [Chloroflexota bacterium]MXZ63278.1 CoA-binding protein [Chloroflexota bacterium]
MIVDGDRAWEVLRDHPRLAIVARSNRTDRPWHDVAGYLIAEGYDVQLVNKMLDEAHGRPCYDSLAEVPEPFDIVDVFRMIPEVPGVVDEAIEVGAPILWLQLEIVHDEAIAKASEAGMQVVVDRCTAIEHRRLLQNASESAPAG